MGQYVIRRLIWLIPTLLAITLITFIIMHLTPGSPLQPQSARARAVPPAMMENLKAKYGLDDPLYKQYGLFLWNAAQFDFGTSYYYKTRQVSDIIGRTFPVSLHLGAMSMAFAMLVGIPLGIAAGVKQNSWVDYICSFTAILGISFPNFVLAILFIWLFVLVVPIIPETGGWNDPSDWILPTIALGMTPLGILARYTRASIVEVMRQDFIQTAKSKGLAERRVIIGHVLKNGLIPPLTILGPLFAIIGTGSFFVESVFQIPGMGRFFVESMTSRDYPMIMAVILIFGIFLAMMNLLVDVLYGVIDPRIRLG